jgi:hypothetical protein
MLFHLSHHHNHVRTPFIIDQGSLDPLKLDTHEVRAFYLNGFTSIPEAWTPKRLARKHFRFELFNGRLRARKMEKE